MDKQKYPNGKHPNSLANLRPQVKGGVARNPHGRPKNRLCLTAIARKKLDEPCSLAPDKTWAEYLVDRWFGQAVENPVYFRELLERMEGKVTQPISGEGGSPLVFKVIVASEHDKENVERVMKGERT